VEVAMAEGASSKGREVNFSASRVTMGGKSHSRDHTCITTNEATIISLPDSRESPAKLGLDESKAATRKERSSSQRGFGARRIPPRDLEVFLLICSTRKRDNEAGHGLLHQAGRKQGATISIGLDRRLWTRAQNEGGKVKKELTSQRFASDPP